MTGHEKKKSGDLPVVLDWHRHAFGDGSCEPGICLRTGGLSDSVSVSAAGLAEYDCERLEMHYEDTSDPFRTDSGC